MDKLKLTNWRVYESADGSRFVLGRVAASIQGPVPFDRAMLVGPPGGDDLVSYRKETGWSVDRYARDVTAEVWAASRDG